MDPVITAEYVRSGIPDYGIQMNGIDSLDVIMLVKNSLDGAEHILKVI